MKHSHHLQVILKKQGKPCIFLGGTPLALHRLVIHLYDSKLKAMEMQFTYRLTNREEEIISLLSAGLGYKEIANNKFISTETVKQHLKNIYRKMGVHNRMKAAIVYTHQKNAMA